MTPYADLLFFGISLYVIVPSIALGLAGRLTWRWTACATALMTLAQFAIYAPGTTPPSWRGALPIVGFTLWQCAIAVGFLRIRRHAPRWIVWIAVAAAVAPLALVKVARPERGASLIGFLGISYVTIRALDTVLATHDGFVSHLPIARYLTYLLFFPTLSAGPIDRWRRFEKDLVRAPTREEYLGLLDRAVHLFFTGLLYKFVLATLVKAYWLDVEATRRGVLHTISYMYAYSAYLFFDFAGYSAFAISYSHALGVRTPPNFDQPFLARDLADFWARWHITLSTWLRDNVYMRFVLLARSRGWVRDRFVASALGLLLTFGLMGVWHGVAARYIAYGLYHGVLLIGLQWWRRRHPPNAAGSTPLRKVMGIALTAQAACFGFLMFSGRLF